MISIINSTITVTPPNIQRISIQAGIRGYSAYDVALQNGFIGTSEDWLSSLKGADGNDGTNGTNGINGINGVDGLSAYQLAINNGFVGTEQEWLDSLVGSGGGQWGAVEW